MSLLTEGEVPEEEEDDDEADPDYEDTTVNWRSFSDRDEYRSDRGVSIPRAFPPSPSLFTPPSS